MGRTTHRQLRNQAQEAATLTGTNILVVRTAQEDKPYCLIIKHKDANWTFTRQLAAKDCAIYLEAFTDGWILRDMQAEQESDPTTTVEQVQGYMARDFSGKPYPA